MKTYFAILFTFLLAGCTQTKEDKSVELYSGFNAHQYMDIFFAGQPDLEKLSELKKKGFATIINLRNKNEGEYLEEKEQAAVQAAGLNYANIPMDGRAPLTDEIITKITKAVVKTRKQGKTLVHCGSGARVAIWVSGHFYKDHGFSKKEAMHIGKKFGLSRPEHIEIVENYLESKK